MLVKTLRWNATSCDNGEGCHPGAPPLLLEGSECRDRVVDVAAHDEEHADEENQRGLQRDEDAIPDARLQQRVEPGRKPEVLKRGLLGCGHIASVEKMVRAAQKEIAVTLGVCVFFFFLFYPSNNLILFRSLLHREAESHTLYIRDLMPPPRSILSRPASPGCFPSKSRGVALAMPNTAPWLQPLRTCQTSASPTGSSQRKRVRGEVRVAEGQGGGAAGAALGGSIPLPSVAAAAEPELLREARTQEVDPVRRHAWWQGGAAVRAGGAPGSRCLSVGRRAWGAKAWGARGAARDGERGAGPRRRRGRRRRGRGG